MSEIMQGIYRQEGQPDRLVSIQVDADGRMVVVGGVGGGSGDALTDAQLRATAVPVSGTVTAQTGLSQPLTDTQLRATAVPVSGTVTAQTGLSQPLTDAQLRATAVPISGTVTAQTGLSQPLTDTQLRAAAVPVAGSAAIGVAPTLPPLSVSGVDGGGLKRHILTDTGGRQVMVSAAPIEVRTNIGALAASATAYSEVMNMGVAADRQHTMLIAHKAGVPSVGENLRIEWSDDQVDWYVSVGRDNGSVSQDAYTSSSSAQMRVKGSVIGRYARVLYINGATPQTALKLSMTAIAGI